MRRFLLNLGIVRNDLKSTTVYSDSQVAITYVKDPKYHRRTKYIDIKNNFIRVIIA